MRRNIRNWGNDILRAAIILLVLFYACWPLRLSGGSMEPTYDNGNVVCVSCLAGFFGGYDRGDVVVFDYKDEDGERQVIKRVIAVGGDTIEIRDGKTFVNGEAIDESYIKEPFHTNYGKVTVPKGFIFVMGDNRNNSEDSRYADVGFVDLSLVKGKASVVFWPFSEFKALP